MALPFFFEENLSSQSTFILSEETSKHVIQVLRMHKGEKLKMTDGKGRVLTSQIIYENKKATEVQFLSVEIQQAPTKKITIAISLIKNNSRFEWFLEKATEIGVNEIIPLICHRTEKEKLRSSRLEQLLISAMLQSRQVWLPDLHEPTSISQLVENAAYEKKYIAHCEDGLKNNLANEGFTNAGSMLMLIGPEGDFTPGEIKQALDKGFKPVTLGENRLRTETAGVVAATLLRLNQ